MNDAPLMEAYAELRVLLAHPDVPEGSMRPAFALATSRQNPSVR